MERKKGFYEKYIKRLMDIVFSVLFFSTFFWLYIVIYILVRIKMGTPVIFKQPRPGIIKNEKEEIFDMYKFRTMSDIYDKDGNLLPDKQRLSSFGAILRSTSLDELPEIFCILKGDMSVVGPRPQLVRDMVFMSKEQRMRHTVKPGLTGLAQVNGRNAVSWEEKIKWDLKYLEQVTFLQDLKIVLRTIVAVFKRDGITDGENVTALDYGDALLKNGRVNIKKYNDLQKYALELIKEHERER